MCLGYTKSYDFWQNLLFPLPSLIPQNEDQEEEGIKFVLCSQAELKTGLKES